MLFDFILGAMSVVGVTSMIAGKCFKDKIGFLSQLVKEISSVASAKRFSMSNTTSKDLRPLEFTLTSL